MKKLKLKGNYFLTLILLKQRRQRYGRDRGAVETYLYIIVYVPML